MIVSGTPEDLSLRCIDERSAGTSEGWYPCARARGDDAWLFGEEVVHPLGGRCWRWWYAVPEGSLVLVGGSFVEALVFSLADGLEGAVL